MICEEPATQTTIISQLGATNNVILKSESIETMTPVVLGRVFRPTSSHCFIRPLLVSHFSGSPFPRRVRHPTTFLHVRLGSSAARKMADFPTPSSKPPAQEMKYFPDMTTALPSLSGEFRRVLWTGLYSQFVIMTVPVGGDIGDEVCSSIPPLFDHLDDGANLETLFYLPRHTPSTKS